MEKHLNIQKNFKLINKTTNEETICTKIVVDGFDYYVSDETSAEQGDTVYNEEEDEIFIILDSESLRGLNFQVIATNNPNIGLSNVIDEADELFLLNRDDLSYVFNAGNKGSGGVIYNRVRKFNNFDEFAENLEGGKQLLIDNQLQESHPNSDKDTIEFGRFVGDSYLDSSGKYLNKSIEDLFSMFKSQQLKVLYYENN